MDIALEEEKPNARIMNSMGYCSLNTFIHIGFFDLNANIAFKEEKIHYVFYELYANIVACIPSI
jgi:hypothetical protein